jgi:hypothetical protein
MKFMKSLLLFSLITISHLFSFHTPVLEFINPTGTYILKGAIDKNRIMGHSGELRAKLLDSDKVAMSFYINKGYPGYESGSFLDTLAYVDNLARYIPTGDSGCTIIFSFTRWMVEIRQTFNDPQSACGFGDGVMVSAFFKKSSDERPIIQDLSVHGIAAQ